MLRLVRSGFGIAMLPRAALEPLPSGSRLELLSCEAVPSPLPLHISWRVDPASDLIDAAVEGAIQLAERAERPPGKGRRRPSSKKLMKTSK
jgi:DNA-binding transcriptional LysR family regulator